MDKDINDYLDLDETKTYIQKISSETRLSISALSYTIKNNQSETIWLHPELAFYIGFSINPLFKSFISEWVYEWMLEYDFILKKSTMKEKRVKEKSKRSTQRI